ANVLGLSARESGYGTSTFTSGNAFFNLETKVAKVGQTPNNMFPYSNGWMQAGKDPLVFVAKYPDYYASALGFFSRYGSSVRGIQDPTAFLTALKNAGFNKGSGFTDPKVL